jgi:hypothetical protein
VPEINGDQVLTDGFINFVMMTKDIYVETSQSAGRKTLFDLMVYQVAISNGLSPLFFVVIHVALWLKESIG